MLKEQRLAIVTGAFDENIFIIAFQYFNQSYFMGEGLEYEF